MKGTIWLDDAGAIERVTLDDPTGLALQEIADPRLRQKDVAQTIAFALEAGQQDEVDWARVGYAAVRRWGASGWRNIKRQAWTGRCWPKEDRE